MSLIKFRIVGMHCKSCRMLIEDVLEEQNAKVLSLDVDEAAQVGYAEVESSTPVKKIMEAIESEGEYKVELL